MKTMVGSSGSRSGLSITSVIELIKISDKMIPSKIEETLIVLFWLSLFMSFDMIFVDCMLLALLLLMLID